jgi:hypothetical protein
MSRNHHPPSTIHLPPSASQTTFFVANPRNTQIPSNTTHTYLITHTMSSRALSMPVRRLAAATITPALSRRSFQSSARMLEVPAGVMPVRKPVGAFRGGFVISYSLSFPASLSPSISSYFCSASSTFSILCYSLASGRVTYADL